MWMVWEKVVPNLAGNIYLMTNNGYGWSAESVIVNGTYDDISPSISQLNNGTIILVWSRGTTGNLNSYQIYTQGFTNGVWSSPAPLVTNFPSNFDPVLLKTLDGSVWMVWSRSSSANGGGDLYYKTFRNASWSAEAVIPTAASSAFEEKLPSLAQAADGRILVVYETNISGNAQIYYTKYLGPSWTTSTALTTTANGDKWPSIAQDRNGTLWVFWARELPNGTTPPPTTLYQWDIFYKSSANNGTSWTSETDLYNSVNAVEEHPTVFQGPDKELWVVYDSCCSSPGNPYGNPNLFMTRSSIIPAHDLAVTSLVVSPSPNPRTGENVTFTVTVYDPGSYAESSRLSLYVGQSLVDTKSVTINPGSTASYTFTWSTIGQANAKYSVKASLAQVSHETIIGNNCLNSTLLFTFLGDVNRDGAVGIGDLALIASHVGAVRGTRNFYASADVNGDGVINISDLTISSAEFGSIIH